MKHTDYPQQQQYPPRPDYPTQLPSAPPTYDEALFNATYNINSASSNPGCTVGPVPTVPIVTPFGNTSNTTFIRETTYIPSSGVAAPRPIIALPLGPNRAHVTCPNCHNNILTEIETQPTSAAHLCCFLIFLIGCCPFSCLPYCMDSMKNVNHTCPNCNVYLGTYHQ